LAKVEKGLKHLRREGRFILAYCFSLLIWVMASLPGDELQVVQQYPENPLVKIILSDAFMHFVLFGLLTFLIIRGSYRGSRRWVPLTIGAVLAIGYGLLIEIYQGILPWRTFGLDDFFWNTVGVLFVLGFVGVVQVYRP
jgi:VanZ family protein